MSQESKRETEQERIRAQGKRQLVIVVVSVYNEEKALDEFYRETTLS